MSCPYGSDPKLQEAYTSLRRRAFEIYEVPSTRSGHSTDCLIWGDGPDRGNNAGLFPCSCGYWSSYMLEENAKLKDRLAAVESETRAKVVSELRAWHDTHFEEDGPRRILDGADFLEKLYELEAE